MHLEAKPAVIVAALLLGRFPCVRTGGVVGREHTEHLGSRRGGISVDSTSLSLLRLLDDRHIAIVREGEEFQAPPIAGGGCRYRSVGVRVLRRQANRVEARTDRVVLERCEDHGITRLADHVDGAADPIDDVESIAGRRETGGCSGELDDQAGIGLAHEPDAGGGVEVLDNDLVLEHIDDVDVVPDTLHRDLLAPHLQASDGSASRPACRRIDRVGDAVIANEQAAIVVVAGVAIDAARASARIGKRNIRERVGVDTDDRAEIVAEVVAQDHGLCTADKDRGSDVRASSIPVRCGRPVGVVLDPTMGHAEITLDHFNHVEPVEPALDRRLSAAKSYVRVVDARLRASLYDEAAPVACGPDVGQVAIGVERAASPETIVAQARKDDRLGGRALGNQLRRAPLQFDPRPLHFHDRTWIHSEPATAAGESIGILKLQGDTAGGGGGLQGERDERGAVNARDRRAHSDTRATDHHANP